MAFRKDHKPNRFRRLAQCNNDYQDVPLARDTAIGSEYLYHNSFRRALMTVDGKNEILSGAINAPADEQIIGLLRDVHVSGQAPTFRKAETTAEICLSVNSSDIGSDRQWSQSASVTGRSPRR